MALRKENFDDDQTDASKKRSRITIDISPELRRRIRMAAMQNDLSISEYLGRILGEAVPDEATLAQRKRQRHPITDEAMERLLQFREEFIKETDGQLFEDSAEILRQEREKRTRYLMGEE